LDAKLKEIANTEQSIETLKKDIDEVFFSSFRFFFFFITKLKKIKIK